MVLKLISNQKTYIRVCLLSILILTSCKEETQKKNTQLKKENVEQTSLQSLEEEYKHNLKMAYENLDELVGDFWHSKRIEHYKKSREYFKLAEPVLSFIDKNNYSSLDAPNILKVKEEDATDIKILKPFGFQVIEELLFKDDKDVDEIRSIAKRTSNRLKLLHKNTQLRLKDYHILWIIRNQIVRIATTGITGFDSPVLSQSLEESALTYKTLQNVFELYKGEFSDQSLLSDWNEELENSIELLNNSSFENFDRFSFIQNHINKQLVLMNKTQQDWDVRFNVTLALNHSATSIFSAEAFNIKYFSDYRLETNDLERKVTIGKKLFHDKRLSKGNDMSCATCHIKEKGFTDGLTTFNKGQKRNTPTITYASLQKAFFHEGRAGSLEGQIVGVVKNHNEFNTDLEHIVSVVTSDKAYKTAFDSLYTKGANDMNIRHAMASYIRTLNKFNSKFDNNINGKETTLTTSERKGFNLFMGKAVCATCHFPPVFNGTVPPNFKDTELEIIGVPDKKVWKNAALDDDLGRYYMFETKERKGAFKTPTIRNVALTAPYMHNGVYDNLEEVMRFYNSGGGQGIGIQLEHQTLPFDKLNLSEEEIKDIIAFMKTLTDEY